MRAFIDVDVQSYLQRIMDVNTIYFKSDFEYDIKTLKDAAKNQLNKKLLLLQSSIHNVLVISPEGKKVLLKITRR